MHASLIKSHYELLLCLHCITAMMTNVCYYRLDEMPGSKWKPELSSLQFQTLLSNLTAIMIRGTFGENGKCFLVT